MIQDEGLRFGLNFSDGVETIPLHQWNRAQCSDSLDYAPPDNTKYSRIILAVLGVFICSTYEEQHEFYRNRQINHRNR